jgi:poly(A) polymerase
MKAFGSRRRASIGDIKRELEVAVETGELPGHQDADFYVEHLRANKAAFGLP